MLKWNIYQRDGGGVLKNESSTNSLGPSYRRYCGGCLLQIQFRYFQSKFLPQRRDSVQICDVVLGRKTFFHEVQRAVITFIRNSSLALLTSTPPPPLWPVALHYPTTVSSHVGAQSDQNLPSDWISETPPPPN